MFTRVLKVGALCLATLASGLLLRKLYIRAQIPLDPAIETAMASGLKAGMQTVHDSGLAVENAYMFAEANGRIYHAHTQGDGRIVVSS